MGDLLATGYFQLVQMNQNGLARSFHGLHCRPGAAYCLLPADRRHLSRPTMGSAIGADTPARDSDIWSSAGTIFGVLILCRF